MDLVTSFYDVTDMFDTPAKLSEAISSICQHVGFHFFAIARHDAHGQEDLLRLHNYPLELVRYHDAHELGARDPVHRASQLRGAGFLWSGLSDIIALTSDDRRVMAVAQGAGVGDGYTVPYHLPGERSGSTSFAVAQGLSFPHRLVPFAQALGTFASEAARRLRDRTHVTPSIGGWLTERERQIVVQLGRGKPEKEIARLLGIAPSTVNDHLAHARLRFGVHKSSLLVVCGLLSGSISYSEVLRH